MGSKGGIQEITHPRLDRDSEREDVVSTKFRHVVGDGVEISRDPVGLLINVGNNAKIVYLYNNFLDQRCPGSTRDMFCICWVDAS